MRTPWTIDRSLLRDALVVTVLAIVGLTALFIIILMMQVMQKVEGVSAASLMRFVPPLASGYQTFLIPVAVCAGCALAYGRFSAEHEFLASMAGGIQPRKLLAPALWLGLLLCIPAYFAAFHWAPQAYNDRDRIQQEALADILDNPPEGGRSLNFPNIGLSYRDQRNGVFEGLVLHGIQDGTIRSTLTCDRAELTFDRSTGILRLFGAKNAVLLTSDASGNVLGQPARFSVQMLEVDVPKPEKKVRASFKGDSPEELVFYIHKELNEGVYNKRGAREFPTIGELIKRLLFMLAPLYFALVGALIGLTVQSRNRIVPLGIALMLAGGSFFGLMTVANRATVEGLLLRNERLLELGGGALKPLAPYLPGLLIGFAPLLLVVLFLAWRLHRPDGGIRIPGLSWAFRAIFSRKTRRIRATTSNTFPMVAPDDEPVVQAKPTKPRRAGIPLSPLAWVIALIPGLKRFDRYFFHTALGSVIMAVVAISALFVAVDYLTNLEQLVHQPPEEIARHYLYLLPPILYMLMPLMVLLGSSFALVRVIKHRELLALQVAGVRAGRALRTFWITACLIVAGMFAAHELLLPELDQQARERRNEQTNNERGVAVALYDQAGAHWRIASYDFREEHPQISNAEVLHFDRFGALKERLHLAQAEYIDGEWWGAPKRFSVSELGDAMPRGSSRLPVLSRDESRAVVVSAERGSDLPAAGAGAQASTEPLSEAAQAHVNPSSIAGAQPIEGVQLPPGLLLKQSSLQEFKPIPVLFNRAMESRRPSQTLAFYRAITYPFFALSLLMLGAVLALRFNARSAFVAGALTLVLALGTYAATFLLESLAVKGTVGVEFAAFAPAATMLVVGFVLSNFLADHISRR